MRLMITGGLGFIGSAVARHFASDAHHSVLNIDKCTYAGNPASVAPVADNPNYELVLADIADPEKILHAFEHFRPQAVLHLAAESHVDRSIDGPDDFIHTNLVGTFNLLNCARRFWADLDADERAAFRFVHVSTDEVFGSLGDSGAFTEATPYQPSSPYSASKAGSDHLARAWHHTYELPVIVTNCSNNYGPYQFPEKLIPLMILKGLAGEALPVYGSGENVRDWLHVEDHVAALERVLEAGVPGETYNIGGNTECTNLEVVESICAQLDSINPASAPHHKLIEFVTDRPGHDFRYAMNTAKISAELGWHPARNFAEGLAATVDWYVNNRDWWQAVLDGSYRLERLGTR